MCRLSKIEQPKERKTFSSLGPSKIFSQYMFMKIARRELRYESWKLKIDETTNGNYIAATTNVWSWNSLPDSLNYVYKLLYSHWS